VFEDWEFLARFCLEGYRLDVIPEFLFYYRAHPGNRSSKFENYRHTRHLLDTYASHLPKWAERYILHTLGDNRPDREEEIERLRKSEKRLKKKVRELREKKMLYKEKWKNRGKRRNLKHHLRRLFGQPK